MENRNVAPRRVVRKVKKQSLWAQLKSRPLLYHAVLIVLTLVAVIILSSILMMLITRHGTHRTVPNFTGVKIEQARKDAASKELEIIINDSLFVPAYEGGIVLDQLPKSGAEVKAGRKIYVTINSFREKMVKVPYVAGRSLRQAKNMLEVAGLGIEKLVYEEDIATNYVLAELVEGKEINENSNVELEMGSGVVLKVGVDPEKNSTIVPKAIGQGLQSAKSRLWEQGLNIGKVNFDEDINLLNQKNARVYRQSLGHNTTTTLGTSVSLWLTLDQEKIDKNSVASDKIAHELEEERLRLEQERQDSLDRAEAVGRNPVFEALQVSSSASKNAVVESEEEEWF